MKVDQLRQRLDGMSGYYDVVLEKVTELDIDGNPRELAWEPVEEVTIEGRHGVAVVLR